MHLSQGFSYMLSIGQFVDALSKMTKVDLLTLDNPDEIKDFYEKNLGLKINENLQFIQMKNSFLKIRSNRIFFKKSVANYIREKVSKNENIVVYTRDYKQMAGLSRKFSSYRNIKFVFESHQIQSQNLCRKGEFLKAKKLKKIEKQVYSTVDGIVSITPTLRQEIYNTFESITPAHIVLPVGVSKIFFQNTRPENFLYDAIYSGNFSEWKGIEVLIEALSLLVKDIPALKVLFVGIREDRIKNIQNQIRKYKLDNVIDLKRRVPIREIPPLLTYSKVGVVAISYKEDGLLYTSPLKLYEYLASGMLVVAASVPSLLSVLPGDLVYWAVPDNPESYCRALKAAIGNQNAKNFDGITFAEDYTWNKRGERLFEFLYKELAW